MSVIIHSVPIDVDLAVKRLKRDMRDDWYPDAIAYEDILVPRVLHRHFSNTATQYRPSPAEQFNIPKAGFTLRYSLEPRLFDRLLYQALADYLIEIYDPMLSDRVFSFRHLNRRDKYIFRPGVDAWLDFVGTTRAEFEGTTQVLVATDIQNFFECITIGDLRKVFLDYAPSDDKACRAAIQLVHELLQRWSPYKYYGIPQNRDASSFLGNMFLHPVDQAMVASGYNYFRYMDDIRIVCTDIYHARRALRDLIIELRHLRLNVNAKKTFILPQGDENIANVLPQPNRMLEQIDTLWRSKRIGQVRRALPMLREYTLSLIRNGQTDDRAFRFCVYRLQAVGRCDSLDFDFSGITDAVIDQLSGFPWSTDMLTRYLQVVDLSDNHLARLVELLEDPQRHIYEWQGFHLWHLLGSCGYSSRELCDLARRTMREASLAPLKAGSILYLGACGTAADRIAIARGFSEQASSFVRRAVIIATQQLASSDAGRYVEPHLDGELLMCRAELRKKAGKPQYYTPPYRIAATELLHDLPNFYAI